MPFEEIYDPTLVWEVENLKEVVVPKKEVTVKVLNVLVNGEVRDFEYKVNFFRYSDEV
ncbi:hypothetical protein AAG747_21040 [Rapidithrix thailandica]|uniref:Uncharacterized protein n=1 Tax=Rapidithrix thailandica TaxID=413964 RepID=A0AAW9S966_9BACT